MSVDEIKKLLGGQIMIALRDAARSRGEPSPERLLSRYGRLRLEGFLKQADSVIDRVDEPAAVQVEVVHEDSVDSLIEAKGIGNTLRKMRLKRSMGLVDLGERSGLSASYLSQLETGRVVPTIRNLMRIAMVFQVDLSVFFRESKTTEFKISRDKERVRLASGSKGTPFMYSQSMSALVPGRRIVPCIAELLPAMGEQVFEARVGQGVEFVYVMEGMVRVSTQQNSEVLEPSDVLWLAADAKRSYQCVGDTAAKVMIISFPHPRTPLHDGPTAI